MSDLMMGASLSPDDSRDYIFNPTALGIESNPAGDVAPVPLSWSVPEQGDVPCCISAAVVASMEFLDYRQPPGEQLSILFHYYVTRKGQNSLRPLYLREGLHMAAYYGICPLTYHKYPISQENASIPPTPEALDAAKEHTIPFDEDTYLITNIRKYMYRKLSDYNRVEDWRAALYARQPVPFVFRTSNAYFGMENSNYDVHPDPEGLVYEEDYHAVAALGYNDDIEAFWVRDSRGVNFGSQGYWWLPYSLVRSHGLVTEAWAVEKISY